jgi:hypothetical protein
MKNLLYTILAVLFVLCSAASCEKEDVSPNKIAATDSSTLCQECFIIYVETFYTDTLESKGYIKSLGTKCGKDSLNAYTKTLRVSCPGGTPECPMQFNKSWYYQCGSTKVVKK